MTKYDQKRKKFANNNNIADLNTCDKGDKCKSDQFEQV